VNEAKILTFLISNFRLVLKVLYRGAQAILRANPFSTAITFHTYSPMKMEQAERSETLAFNRLASEFSFKFKHTLYLKCE
jgi:hypothetical protein